MIHDTDRAGYFGGSETYKYIMNSNQSTKTWQNFWLEKIGVAPHEDFDNIYTKAGNNYEHSILKAIDKNMVFDEQLIIKDLRLRVNYDGTLNDTIYEVKTHKAENDINVKKGSAYWMQVQVQMYCYKEVKGVEPRAYIVEYPLYPEDYLIDVDEEDAEKGNVAVSESRIKLHEIEYDSKWINKKYLPRLKELAERLKEETDGKEIMVNTD